MAQRITGMGFALVAAPSLILVVGGFAGVLVVNVCAALTSAAILTRLWREVDWARWRVLVAGALIGILPGAWLVSGAVSGLMSVTAGVGGPAVSTYAVATGWQQRAFAATMQPYALTIGLLSVSAKLALNPTASPLSAVAWGGVLLTCAVGVVVGERLQSRISQVTARRLLIALALAGACAAIGRGLWTILQG